MAPTSTPIKRKCARGGSADDPMKKKYLIIEYSQPFHNLQNINITSPPLRRRNPPHRTNALIHWFMLTSPYYPQFNMASSRIFIKGLPPNITEDDFKSHFGAKQEITDAKLLSHRRIGYIGYKTPEDAARAVKYFNKSFVRMSKIGVEIARPVNKPQRSNAQPFYANTTEDIRCNLTHIQESTA